jgi:hypothetical protein
MSTPEFNSIEIAQRTSTTPPKHRVEARKKVLAKVLVAGLVLSGISLVPQFTQQVPGAQASVPADSVALYISAPMTQASDATGSVSVETFDSFSLGTCPTSLTSIRATLTESGDACRIWDPGPLVGSDSNTDKPWGGATTTSSTPSFGGTNSRYMMVYDPRAITLTLEESVRYVGFYWTSGGAGNQVAFYDASDRLIATFTTDRITEVLGSSKTSDTTLSAVRSDIVYKQRSFFGDPAGHVSLTPTQDSTRPDKDNIYTYLNLYVGGSIEVKKIVFSNSAGGFEFDNLTTSLAAQTPAESMVKLSEKVSLAPLVVAPPSGGGGGVSSTFVPAPQVKLDPCVKVATAAVNRKSRTFSGFAINSARLTPSMKRQISTWLNKHPEEVCVSVAGFTMGPRVLPTDPKLAKDRARAVRAYIKSLRPEASFTPITARTQRLVGDEVRRAKVTLRF